MSEIDAGKRSVRRAKATAAYWRDVKVYGSEREALKALDCNSRDEAIDMLTAVQRVSVFKCNGKVIIQ